MSLDCISVVVPYLPYIAISDVHTTINDLVFIFVDVDSAESRLGRQTVGQTGKLSGNERLCLPFAHIPCVEAK